MTTTEPAMARPETASELREQAEALADATPPPGRSTGRFTPQPAVRKGQKARVALAGPSGSGKTWTGLECAMTLAKGERVLVADTERGSASLYADYFDFDVVEWTPPFDPRELAALIADQAPNYGVILCDSLSHFWEAEGGTLGIVDAAAARSRGNSFAGWKEGTPAQNDMIAAMLNAPCHIVATMRSKTEYVLEADSRGKQVPRKIGMAPVQRAGIEYEFTVTADLDYEHTLLVDKTRCHDLAGKMFKMGHTVELAEILRDWLGTALPIEPPAPEAWTVATAKQALLGAFGGDRDTAAAAWALGSGDALTEFSEEAVDRIVHAWHSRPTATTQDLGGVDGSPGGPDAPAPPETGTGPHSAPPEATPDTPPPEVESVPDAPPYDPKNPPSEVLEAAIDRAQSLGDDELDAALVEVGQAVMDRQRPDTKRKRLVTAWLHAGWVPVAVPAADLFAAADES